MQLAICTVVYWIIGGGGDPGYLGAGLATLAVCSVSAAAALGKASWGMVITVIAGIGIMYGCAQLATLFVGGNGCY